jgi:hypothetical protein
MEREAAMEWALPGPWATEDTMATDINGFNDVRGAMRMANISNISKGMGDLGQADNTAAAASSAVTKEAMQAGAEAKAAGASDSEVANIINQVVNFGSEAASLYMQKRELDTQKRIESAQRRLLAAQAAQRMPAPVATQFAPSRPFYKHPAFLIGAGLLAAGGAVLGYKAIAG